MVAALCCGLLVVPSRARGQQQEPEDPEAEKQIGLWLDEPISVDLSSSKSLEFEFHQRFDEGATRLFEYFFQGGVAFRARPWLTVTPIYRYQRYRTNPTTSYENRLQINLNLSRSWKQWQPSMRTLIEARIPENRIASARIRFRPNLEYRLPVRMARPPLVGVNNEFFMVPGENSYAAGGWFTQDTHRSKYSGPVCLCC